MNQFPQTFGDMYRAMVNAGEQAGQLGPVLDQLADYTESRQHTSQKLQMAVDLPLRIDRCSDRSGNCLDGVCGS
jgi:general secretion pathway protein F